MDVPGNYRRPSVGLLARNLWLHSRRFPFATNLSLVSVPIGVLAIIVGPQVSKAFSIVYPNQAAVIYTWGVFLIGAGIGVAYGVASCQARFERAGLIVLSLPWTFYGISVMVGLGAGGLVTAPLTLALAVACVLRAHGILLEARQLGVVANSLDDARDDAVIEMAALTDALEARVADLSERDNGSERMV